MNIKSKQGDISLLVTLLVCSILLLVLTPLSRKIAIESNISKENLMSQQAIQSAKTGLEAWKYNLVEDKIDYNNSGALKNWPNSNTDISFITPNPPDTNWENNWIVLDNSLGIQYRVEFIPSPDGGITSPKIIGRGRVKRGSTTVERVFEESFNPATISTGKVKQDGIPIEKTVENTLPTVSTPTCTPVSFDGVTSRSTFAGGWGSQVFVIDRTVGITAPWSDFMFAHAISFSVSNVQNAVDTRSTTFFAPGNGTYIVTAASDNVLDDGSTGNGSMSALTIDGKTIRLGTIYTPQVTSISINGPKTVTINMTIGNSIEGGNNFLENPMGMAFTITANDLINCP